MTMREDANQIIAAALRDALPDEAVRKALENWKLPKGKLVLVAAGKGAWQMASCAAALLKGRLSGGVCVTKYAHVAGDIPCVRCFEAGHPVLDQNGVDATQAALELVCDLGAQDGVLFLLSGGGSALFEKPLIALEELQDVTRKLLASGADIVQMNTIRKRLSAVKGGRFAQLCAPAQVFTVVLSDVIGDPLDMIASGPAYPDSSICAQALEITQRYQLNLSETAMALLGQETPKTLNNVQTHVTGSVRQLCASAKKKAEALGYKPVVLSASLCCTARDAGSFLASMGQYYQDTDQSLAFIAGGETVVQLTGTGLGGRNQELALAAAVGLAGLRDTAVFSIGSDGTDGPTDAAGGYADQDTQQTLRDLGIGIDRTLAENDAYHALQSCGGLIMTGPTGTNVNDLSVLLIKR